MPNDTNTTYIPTTCYMPDGRPCPELLTEQEAITFLRLDTDGPKNPEQTLQYYRSEGLLKATKVGKRLRYTKSELLQLLDRLTERTNGDIS
jgi:hypothetical protein